MFIEVTKDDREPQEPAFIHVYVACFKRVLEADKREVML